MVRESDIIRFTAPDARLLIVDDISSNLVVAEGLLSPYNMQVDCCSGGVEALALTTQYHYDLIFMDHLMPGLSGIEAVAKIREQEALAGENNPVPVIALTADAVSGMREMFLASGFNDYLSKPIEISKLDGAVRKWIPREKQIRNSAIIQQEAFGGGPFGSNTTEKKITIPGIETAVGQRRTGGSEEGYRKVLAAFRRDALERLPLLEKPPGDLHLFTAQVHALKRAAATIGALPLSEEAAKLEMAGHGGDLDTIQRALPAFYGDLKVIAAAIGTFLESAAPTGAGVPAATQTENLSTSREEFLALQRALREKDIEALDRLLAGLEKKTWDWDTGERLSRISDAVLLSDFNTALEDLEKVIAKL
jgi:CheY-like chemotaxis protein